MDQVTKQQDAVSATRFPPSDYWIRFHRPRLPSLADAADVVGVGGDGRTPLPWLLQPSQLDEQS